MINTSIGTPISEDTLRGYFSYLVSRFFKILPMQESKEKTLPTYIRSFQVEMLGCKEFVVDLDNNPEFLTLLSILQYLHDNPESPVSEVKREVFRAIAICNKLESRCVRRCVHESF